MSIPWSKPNIFGIKWDNGPNQPASPLKEISRDEFLRLFHCGAWGLDGLNYGGSAPLPDADGPMYRWHYYFFHREALAVATRYMNALHHQGYPPTGKFLASDGDDGYDIHFYRLGCQHENQKWDSPRMHDQHVKCPDCGFEATYDSSG